MAAKSWETDFRYAAIQASLKLFTDDIPADVHSLPRSFVLPIAARPVIGFTPGKLTLVLLVVGFAFLGMAVWIMPGDKKGDPGDPVLVTLAVLCTLSGMGCFFVPAIFSRSIASWFVGTRGRELRKRAGAMKLRSAELSNGDLGRQRLAIDGDDYVLIYMDATSRRLLIEGVAARYQIRGEDVRFVRTFIFENYIGAQICCRIDDQTDLLFAIARVSLAYEVTRQLPFLFFMRKWIRNRLCEEASATLTLGK